MKTPSAPILVVAGSNRVGSLTQAVATHYVKALQDHAQAAQLLSLQQLPEDFTQRALYEHREKHPGFNRLIAPLYSSTKYVFIVPTYNVSFPGVLKAFIDGLPVKKIFPGKKIALVGLSEGRSGGALALSHLTDILLYLGAIVHPLQPQLAHVASPTWEAVAARPDYIRLLQRQIVAFSAF